MATADAPPRRRDTWSIRRIAEEIGGRPIAEFQGKDGSPRLDQYPTQVVERLPPRTGSRLTPSRIPAKYAAREDPGEAPPEELDPVARVYPL